MLGIVNDRKESRKLQKELQEQRKALEGKGKYVGKLEGILTKFGKEVKRVEELEKEILAPKEISKTSVMPSKLMKPPDLSLFSGVEPVPMTKDPLISGYLRYRELWTPIVKRQ